MMKWAVDWEENGSVWMEEDSVETLARRSKDHRGQRSAQLKHLAVGREENGGNLADSVERRIAVALRPVPNRKKAFTRKNCVVFSCLDLIRIWGVLLALCFFSCNGFTHFPRGYFVRTVFAFKKFSLGGSVGGSVAPDCYREYLSLLKNNTLLEYKYKVAEFQASKFPESTYLKNVTVPNLQEEINSLQMQNEFLLRAIKTKEILKEGKRMNDVKVYEEYMQAIADLNDKRLSKQLKNTTLIEYFGKRRDGRKGIFHYINFDRDSDALIGYKLHVLAIKLVTINPSVKRQFDYMEKGLVEAAISFLMTVVPLWKVAELTDEERKKAEDFSAFICSVKMPGDDEAIIDEICEYAQEYQVKDVLQEYLKRIVMNKPEDPIKFLVQSIRENPYVPPKEPQTEN